MHSGWLAASLYLIGMLATATGPLEEDFRIDGRPIWAAIACGIAWPLLALILIASRLWRLWHG